MRFPPLLPALALSSAPFFAERLAAQEATPPAAAVVRGLVVDSINGGLLSGGLVRVQGTAFESLTNEFGEFRIADLPPGTYRMLLLHPIIDTLGITLMTPPVTLRAGDNQIVDIAIPSGETLAQVFCPAARRMLGPAVLAGVVRDPDTGEAIGGARVSLLYYESDQLGLTRMARVREASTDSTGRYRVCGLPPDMSGKVQVFHEGISSGEVNVEVKDGFVALRSLSIAPRAPVVVARATPDSAAQPAPAAVRMEARVSGRVVDRLGRPISGARVGVQGTTAVALTRDDGTFTLDSLPSGTQALDVRKIGFTPADAAVELSVLAPATVTVSMSEHVPTLEPVRVEAARERALLDVGYFQRKRSGIGRFLDGDEINRNAIQLTDALRQVPNIRVVPAGPGMNVLASARDPHGCVALYIDGTLWRQMAPGDVDSFVRPDEVEAIESYTATNVPPQFANVGGGRCDTVVIWTSRRINRGR